MAIVSCFINLFTLNNYENQSVIIATNDNKVVNVTCVTNATKLDNMVNVTTFVTNTIVTDMAVNENTNDIIDYLKGKGSFAKEDFYAFFKSAGINLTDEALRIRIHRLKKKGIVQSIARGKYTVSQKPFFTHSPDKLMRKVTKLFLSKYEELDYCMWSTNWLLDLMLHIPVRSFYVFETEKDICEPAFYLFKDNGINAYYQPNQDQIDKYILPEENSIIVRPLISRAPYRTIEKTRIASIEKILVDLYCDTEIFYIYGGSELIRIYENVLNHYRINFSALLQYAERRKRNKEIRKFMLDNFGQLVKDIIA